ncbi:biotin carboxylase N-terminal domain-containing protein [uncultured Arthrobacter sp.]|uniref:acetyl/propionyl/methylcrotonyl-CoA carboxylase subunit alpha n=1 Tax=uncultured Arthrobacter sp. TaxID=114050 RepID=UPI0025E72807|nr:biotin carboxylase N-terminal domain-containing protein [uncultured Arthrobacter sp.]
MTAPHRPPFSTVLVANRGEIACRVIRTLRSLGIRSVAVYSDADAGARHVREADTAVRIGPASAAESYLSAEAILAACRRTGAEAVHPGYGFLSENAGFARALAEAGIVFIGPDVHALNVMGDKIRSKNHVAGHGVPVVPGLAEPGLTDEQLIEAAENIGYPLLIKPSAGGGGKGMHAVYEPEELPAVLLTARRVAASAFGDDTLFLERLIPTPRHIEVQVLADQHGNVVHLGERECSLQRRHQKVIEEAPSALLTEATRARIGEAACNAARSVNYTGAGTVEFLVSDASPDEFFFMEMNTRLQVEHPVTELVTGVDLVEWQVRIAGGEALAFGQDDVVLTGHAVEARVYAENPEAGFLPSSGTVLRLEEPAGEGIRVDSSLLPGLTIPAAYDPMLSKVIAWGADRTQALDRLDTALASSVVLGIDTNTEYLRLLIGDEDVRDARLDTTLIERKLPGLAFRTVTDADLAVLAVGMLRSDLQSDGRAGGSPAAAELPPWQRRDGFRLGVPQPRRLSLEVGPDDVRAVSILPADSAGPNGTFAVAVDDGPTQTVRFDPAGGAVVDGVRTGVAMVHADGVSWLGEGGWSVSVRRLSRSARLQAQLALVARAAGTADPLVRSPMPGTVVSVSVSDGDAVEEGQVLLAVEAMKMEHQLRAAVAGTVHLNLKPGDLVRADQVVASIHVEEAVPAGESAGQEADQDTADQQTAAQETAAQEPTAKEVSAR